MAQFNKVSSNEYRSSTVSNLRSRIYIELGETDTELFSNSVMFQWIKDALNEINIRDTFYFQEAEGIITLQNNEFSVALPTNIKEIGLIRKYVNGKAGDVVGQVTPEQYTKEGTSFAIRNNTLLLPLASEETKYIVEYKGIPELPANVLSNSLLPSQFDSAIIDYVVAKAKTMEGMMSDAHFYMTKFEQDVELIKDNSHRRVINTPMSFTMNSI